MAIQKKRPARARRNDDDSTTLVHRPAAVEIVPSGVGHELNPAWVYIRGLSEGSAQETMESVCKTIAALDGRTIDTMPWSSLRYPHVQLIRQKIAPPKYAVSTANKIMSGLRGVLRECMQLGLIGGDDYIRASRVKGFRGSSLPAGRALTVLEVTKLFAAADPANHEEHRASGVYPEYFMALRDRAMLSLLYGAGLRRDEAVKVNIGDFSKEDGVRVHGKGKKERMVPIGPWALSALDTWIAVRTTEAGAILCFVGRYGKIKPSHRLTSQVIADRLIALAKTADIRRLGPHDLRRTFVTLLLDEGADALSVQKLAGHERLDTTVKYDRRAEKAKKAAAAKLPSPMGGAS